MSREDLGPLSPRSTTLVLELRAVFHTLSTVCDPPGAWDRTCQYNAGLPIHPARCGLPMSAVAPIRKARQRLR